jgi:outer membrane protein insertion porin family
MIAMIDSPMISSRMQAAGQAPAELTATANSALRGQAHGQGARVQNRFGRVRQVGAQVVKGLRVVVASVLMLAVIPVVMVALAPIEAAAQTVSAVEVEGNRRVDDETVRSYVTLVPGDRYSESAASESIGLLFATGLFEDVTIGRRGSVVVVTVIENPIINRVVFEGNKKVEDEVLAREVESQPRGMLTRARVQRDTERILQIYRRLGRFGASVEPKVIDLAENRVNLVFEIVEDEKTSVSRINFIGNSAFSDRELRDVIITRQRSLLSFLSSNDVYDPDRVEADQELLRRFYLQSGYADFRVISAVADLDRERNGFFITYTIEEGPQYAFGPVSIESDLTGLDSAALEYAIKTREGRIYNAELVEKSAEELTIELARNGYPFARVVPRPSRDFDNLVIAVTYQVQEGRRAYVERINIRGNTRTLDEVIRREFDFAEGDPYNRVLVDQGKRRLQALRFFEKVDITATPGSAPDRIVLDVVVEEQSTGDISLGGGFSTSTGFSGELSLTERNFLGTGRRVKIGGSLGERASSFNAGITEPYFMGRRVSASLDGFVQTSDNFDEYGYGDDRIGGSLSFTGKLNEDLTLSVGYTGYQRDIRVEQARVTSAALIASSGSRFYSIPSYSLVYSTLDNSVNPTSGTLASIRQEVAGLGGDINFLRTTAKAQQFFELRPSIISFVRLQGAHITGFGGDTVLPVDGFNQGASIVRGFESTGIGPRDAVTTDPIGAKTYLGATAEVQFPMPLLPDDLGFTGAVFADAGTAFGTDLNSGQFGAAIPFIVQDSSSIRSSVGASVLWDSPFGLLRVDVAVPLTKEDFDKTQVVKFGAGTRF